MCACLSHLYIPKKSPQLNNLVSLGRPAPAAAATATPTAAATAAAHAGRPAAERRQELQRKKGHDRAGQEGAEAQRRQSLCHQQLREGE